MYYAKQKALSIVEDWAFYHKEFSFNIEAFKLVYFIPSCLAVTWRCREHM